MATTMGSEGAGVVGVIVRSPSGGLRLTLRSTATRRALAVVDGSEGYLLRALVAVGLPPPLVASLRKVGHGARLSLVGSEPRRITTERLG